MARTKVTAKPKGKAPAHRGTKRQPVPSANNNTSVVIPAHDYDTPVNYELVKFVFFYSNVNLHASSMHEASEGVITGELKQLLINLQGPLLIDHLVDNRPYHDVTYNEHERQLLLDLLCRLGIFTSEKHYKGDLWQSIQNMETLFRNTGVMHVHQSTVCTVWLIESRRQAIYKNPTEEDIRWVEKYQAEKRKNTEWTLKVSQHAKETMYALDSADSSLAPPDLDDNDSMKLDEDSDIEWLNEYEPEPTKKNRQSPEWGSFSD